MNQGKMVSAHLIELANLQAKFSTNKTAIKVHTLLDLKPAIKENVVITDGSVHNVIVLDPVTLPGESHLVMNKIYVDYKRLYLLAKENINFIVRAKDSMNYKVVYR